MAAGQHAAIPFHRRNVWNFRHVRHAEGEGAGRWRQHLHGPATLFGLAESGAQGLRAAIAPDGELNGAARRNFMNHAPELRGAFHALPVDLRHDVVSL